MSIADAEKIEEEIARRQENSRQQQRDIDRETDDAARDQKIRDKEEFDAETRGMQQVAQNLRANPAADARMAIPRISGVEGEAVRNLRAARDEAQRLGQQARVRQLDR